MAGIGARRAEAVRRALEPDNTGFPEGLSMRVEEAGGGLAIELESRGPMGPLLSTVDEVLAHAQAALGAAR